MQYNGIQQNSPNNALLYFSILSWLLLTINNLASLKSLYREHFSVWNIQTNPTSFLAVSYTIYASKKLRILQTTTTPSIPATNTPIPSNPKSVPLQIEPTTIYKIFNFYFIITCIGCATLIYKSFIKKDQIVIDGMFGKYSKYHFIPLLFAFSMSLLGETLKLKDPDNDVDKLNPDDIAYAGLAISLVGLICMIFIYINTNINSNDWWVHYVFNKGTFSCLIILFWYNFCYDIFLIRYCNNPLKTDIKWIKGTNLAFSIIFGISSMVFSYVFKDIIICLINIFIYNDLAAKNINPIDEEPKENLKNVNYLADGTIDMLILISSALLLIYIIVEKVKGMIDQMKNQITLLTSYQQQIANGINANTQSINQIVNLINTNKKNE